MDVTDVLMVCAIWYHLHNFKNVKNTHGVVLLLVKLQASVCNFTENNTPPWVFFHIFKIVQMVPNQAKRLIFIGIAYFSTIKIHPG